MTAYFIKGIINNRPIFFLDRKRTIEHNLASAIIPFARYDVVTTFMDGISPEMKNFYDKKLNDLSMIVNKNISDKLKVKLGEEKIDNELLQQIQKMISEEVVSIKELAKKAQWDLHAKKIIDAVNVLPEREMANMAEALINVTSLRSKVSLDLDSVGGDIDVAVITKGDGFVWVKRKSLTDTS